MLPVPSSAPRPILSVVVATRDRAASLALCLRHLAVSSARLGAASELVVVDNGSTDETARVIAAAAVERPAALVPVSEPRPGLSRARNAGLRHARAGLIAVTDDDCRVEPDWMAAIVRRFADDPDIDAVGGRVLLDDPGDAPVSIRTATQARRIADIDAALASLIGCNFAFRRSLIDRIGVFDERLGAGSAARSAEDLDLWYRMLRGGAGLLYDPAILLRHAHGRRGQDAVAALRRGYAVGRGAFFAKHALRGDREAWRRLAWALRAREPRARAARRDLLHGVWLRLSGR